MFKLQTYLLDILVKVTIETREKNHQFRNAKINAEKRAIETTLMTLYKAELINTDTYKRLWRYFGKVSLPDCEI